MTEQAHEPGRPPRLCILVHDLSATGVVRNALALSAHFAGSMDVALATVRDGGVLSGELDPRVVRIELRGGRLARLIALRRWLRRDGTDLLLSVGNRGHLFGWLVGLGREKLRCVFRLSNSLAHRREGDGFRRRLRSLGRHVTLRLIARRAELLVANSPSLARELRPLLGPDADLCVIPNGVDVDRVRRRAAAPGFEIARRDAAAPLALAVGRLVEQKNHETLIDALAVANRTRPIDLAILGGGTAKAHDRLRRRASAAGVADRLHLLPPCANPFAIMRQASLFVMPSWWEGSSNALMEAMACGLPVVVSDRAGSAHDVLRFGRHGLLVDPSDVEGMAAAMLLQAGDQAVLPGERARDCDVAVMLDRYDALLRDVLATPVTRRISTARRSGRVRALWL